MSAAQLMAFEKCVSFSIGKSISATSTHKSDLVILAVVFLKEVKSLKNTLKTYCFSSTVKLEVNPVMQE